MIIGSFILGPLGRGTPIDVTEMPMDFERLPGAFDGFRVALVMDLHFGRFVRADFVREVLELIAGLRADLLLLGGDMVDRPRHFTHQFAEMLKQTCGDIASYAILGNHDRYSGGEEFCRILRAAGVDVLVNEHRLLRRGGEAIALAGLDDNICGTPDAHAATAGIEKGTFVILAAHNPDLADMPGRTRTADVMFAGHTHGGQVRILGRPIAKKTRNRSYMTGLVQAPGFPMYVSRGLGVTGIPIRFNSTPELPIITLRSKLEP